MAGRQVFETLEGSEDPSFQAAIEIWLQDNDKDSLSVFAALAREGNLAARLLLARIEATEQAASKFVSALSRKERIDLFRSDSGKGLFRPSWLKSEKNAGNQFASVLLESASLGVHIDAIRNLYEVGENEAAYDLIREVAGVGSQDEKQELIEFLPDSSELLPYLLALQKPVAGVSVGHTALQQIVGGNELRGPESDRQAAARFVEFGYQTGVQNSGFNSTNFYYDKLASWIDAAPVTAPIATLCHRYCGSGSLQYCAVTSFGLVGGYYKAIRFDSPIQTLIEQSRYTVSDRAAGMVLRRISFARPASAGSTLLISNDQLRENSACLAKAVAGVRAQGY